MGKVRGSGKRERCWNSSAGEDGYHGSGGVCVRVCYLSARLVYHERYPPLAHTHTHRTVY